MCVCVCGGGGGGGIIRGQSSGGQLEGNYPLKYLFQTSLRGRREERGRAREKVASKNRSTVSDA